MINSKICILTETYHPLIGGGETQARALAEGLVSRGLPVIVLTRRSDPSLRKTEHSGKVTIHRLPPVGRKHLKKWALLLTCIPALIKLRRHYDLILVCGFRVLGVAAVTISKLLGKQCVLKADSLGEMSGEFFSSGLAKVGLKPSFFIVRLFLRIRDVVIKRADAFVAISSAVEQELATCGVTGKSVQTIPNSVDTNRFYQVNPEQKRRIRDRLGLPAQAAIVIFTGRLVSYKGLPLLLKVWQQIGNRRSNVILLLVGSGSLDIHNCEAELRAFVTANGMDPSVRFLGAVDNVHEYLQASDLFVFPTESEAFGISLIEAMSCSLPVISTSVGGVNDILQHQENGLLVQPGDFHQLHDAIETLLSEPEFATQLGRAARRTVEERYSTKSVTARYIELFRSLAF